MNRRRFLAAGAVIACLPATAAATPTRFSVRTMGEGPDVVLIPGLVSSSDVWNGLAPGLARTRRLHLIQVAGFAGAPAGPNAQGPVLEPLAEEIGRYIAELGSGKAAVIGHSIGGFLGVMLARNLGPRVDRLMVVDGLPYTALMFNPAATPAAMAPMATMIRDQASAMTQAAFAEQYRAQDGAAIARLVASPEGRNKAQAWAIASDPRVYGQVLYDGLTLDLRPDLPSIRAPATIVYAHQDAADKATAEALFSGAFAGLPNKQLRAVEGSRHYIMLDQPAAFAREVDTFLA